MGVNSINNSLYTALSGIQTTQALLNTTSRNITNAQTPGYVVKQQDAVSNAATGGALAGPIKRFIDASLLQKLRTNNGDAAFTQTRADALTKMDQLAGDPASSTSIAGKINTLGAAFQDLTANPHDASSAEAVLNSANDLAQSFRDETGQIMQLQTDASLDIVDGVAQVNSDLQQIAMLNQKVVSASANGRDPTDLMDQRDIAISDLSKLIGVNAFTDNQGVVQVLSGDFHPLAGLYAEVVSFNQTTNTLSVSGHQLSNINGSIGGNLQVLTGDTVKRLANLSEVATQLTLEFQALPTSTLNLTGSLPASGSVQVAGDSAASPTFTLITDSGNQYTATVAYRPTTPGVAGNIYQAVITSLVPIGTAPAVNLPAYTAATSTGGLVIGTLDATTTPPSFAGNGSTTAIPAAVSTSLPGNIFALNAYTTNMTVGASTAGTVTPNNAMTLFTQSSGAVPAAGPYNPPYYSGNIIVSPNITARALQVGDAFKGTTQDNNANGASAAASTILNRLLTFTTSGIAGSYTVQNAAGTATVGIGQDLSTANSKITELTTAATQIQAAIAPNSEVNLDAEMGKLVVLQNLYQANARVVSTVSQLLDTLINLPT